MIHLKDLHILQQLFFKDIDQTILFDTEDHFSFSSTEGFLYCNDLKQLQTYCDKYIEKRLLILNFSSQKQGFNFDQKNIAGAIHFNWKPANKKVQSFYYINNRDQSMRWIFPNTNTQPAFLALYNNTGWKAKAYKAAMKMSYQLGLHSKLCSGIFYLQTPKDNIQSYFHNQPVDEFAIFTGTAGKNRKAIIALFQKKTCSHFVKIPLTKKAIDLITNERSQLEELKDIQLQKMVTPIGQGNQHSLCLSNIQPTQSIATTSINDRHFKALDEWYTKTIHHLSISELSLWNQIKDGVAFLQSNPVIQNDLAKEKIQVINHHLQKTILLFDNVTSFPVALGHGDFTPWNMYETAQKIHVYDWEMGTSDLPLLFDAFHYIFQNNILIHQQPYSVIKVKIDQLQKNPIIKKIIEDHSIDWSQHYAFYLLYIVSYYMPLYIQQKDLHMQAHWLVDCWVEALLDVVRTMEAVSEVEYSS